MRLYILALTFLLVSQTVHALSFSPGESTGTMSDYYIAPSFLYYSGLRSRSSREENAYITSDLRFGYQIHPSFYFGPIYQFDQKNTESTGFTVESFNNTVKLKRNSIGVSLSYLLESVHFALSYYIQSKLELNTLNKIGSSDYNYTGTGFQFDLGYRFSLWGLSLGPQLSYKSYQYPKLEINGDGSNDITPKLEESNFEPSLTAYYFF